MMRRHIVRSIVCTIGIALGLNTTSAVAQYVNPPRADVLKNTPGLSHHTFNSRAMGAPVGYNVVLPKGYAEGTARHPVVYWLHGRGSNESTSLFVAKTWRTEYRSKPAPILVFPAAFRSWYIDQHDGKVQAETMIIRELIPLIDRKYRTIAAADGRAVHGFSMGSSGALKFAAKYPQTFCAAVGWGGGSIDLEHTKLKMMVDVVKRKLNNDPQLIRENNTYYQLKKNGDTLCRTDVRYLLILGAKDGWRQETLDFYNELQRRKISSKLVLVPNVGHNLAAMHKAEGKSVVAFQKQAFRDRAKKSSMAKQK